MINATTAQAIDPQRDVRRLAEAQPKVIEVVDARVRRWPAVLGALIDAAGRTWADRLGGWALYGNPRFFEFDRASRAVVDLAAGVTGSRTPSGRQVPPLFP